MFDAINGRPALIIGAEDGEIENLKSKLKDPVTERVGYFDFTSGKLGSTDVIMVKCGVGMVNAAAATALGICRYSPACVVSEGTSGAHNPELHRGDIVLGQNVVQTGRFRTEHKDAGEGSSFRDWIYIHGIGDFAEGEDDKEYPCLHSDARLLEIARGVNYDGGKVVSGTHATSDQWNREIDRIAFLHEKFNSDCEEMESFAIAQVCANQNVPFIGIRIISNSELHDEDFLPEYGITCQGFVGDFVEELSRA